MKEIQGSAAQLTKVLLNAPDSGVAKFINSPPPENDYEYVQMWISFHKHVYVDKDYFRNLIKDGWLGYDNAGLNFETRYVVWREIKKAMLEALNKKLDAIAFRPRLETYVETFPENEQTPCRKLILGYLTNIQDHKYGNNLMETIDEVEVDRSFVLSLDEEYKLFSDKVIELDSSSFRSELSFLKRDMLPNLTIYKIFARLKVSEKELLTIGKSPLISLFDLGGHAFDPSIVDGSPDIERKFDDDEFDFDADTEDIDKLIKKLEKRMQIEEDKDEKDDDDLEEDTESEYDEGEEAFPVPTQGSTANKEGDLKAYNNDLEYLDSEFKWIAALAEIKETTSRTFSFDREDEKKIEALQQKCKKQKKICEIRLQKSAEKKVRPRLEMMGDLLKLNDQERDMIKILVTNNLFVTENRFSGNPTVGDLLGFIYEDPIDRIQGKKMFLKNSRLVRSNIIQLETRGINKNLFECDVIIDNRLVEYLIGENYDISNYVEGSVFYKPDTHLDHVILPEENKKALLNLIDYFPSYLKAKKDFALEVAEYGDSLVLLFVGPSGTGKTMLANAIANYLKRRILIYNANSNSGAYRGSDEGIFSLLFREARMSDAILFFDEAEELLERRMNELLVQIEKHHGIVIFATNASFRIDEAMRRRINHIQHFQEPGPALRKRIWEIHLPQAVKQDKNFDLELLSKRFEINGGLIKNAVFSALAKAVSENGSEKPTIKLEHLMEGAKEQLRNKLFMSKLEEPRMPQKGFDSLVLSGETLDILNDLANIEKARKVLIGEWGFNEVFPDHNGMAVLFYGPPGTGKTYSAEALAFETGKKLKIVNYAQVISMFVGGTEKALEALFNEVADTDSILLFDEADAVFTSRTGVSTSNDRFANAETDVLLGLIERFNSMAILTTNYIDNIDKAFFRRMQYIVEFKEPDKDLRIKLWKILCPPKLPLSDGVDFVKLASDFEFTGGEIKKAIIQAATKRAVRLDQDRSLRMRDLLAACNDIANHKWNKFRKIGF